MRGLHYALFIGQGRFLRQLHRVGCVLFLLALFLLGVLVQIQLQRTRVEEDDDVAQDGEQVEAGVEPDEAMSVNSESRVNNYAKVHSGASLWSLLR